MNILLWIVIIIGGGTGLFSCLYIMVSLFAMIVYKFYRKIKYHVSFYEQDMDICYKRIGDRSMDIIVIIMAVIVAAAGVAGFIMEHGSNKKDKDSEEKDQSKS